MPFAVPSESYLDMTQLVRRWHVSRATIDRWRKLGIPNTTMKLSAFKLGRRVLFAQSMVEQIEAALVLASAPVIPIRRRR